MNQCSECGGAFEATHTIEHPVEDQKRLLCIDCGFELGVLGLWYENEWAYNPEEEGETGEGLSLNSKLYFDPNNKGELK
jgi:hypothetical protein